MLSNITFSKIVLNPLAPVFKSRAFLATAKIASSVDAGILGFEMYRQGKQFVSGDGIVAKGFEANVKNIGRLGKTGMKTTDAEILEMMLDS